MAFHLPGDRRMSDSRTLELVELCRQGDQDAADELFNQYVSRLVALARSHLSPKMNARVDPEDIVQSAYRSFFIRSRKGNFSFDEGGDLWRLLAAMTLNKLHRQVERHTAEKRSVDREKGNSDPELVGFDPKMLSKDPSPDDVLIAAEKIEDLMKDYQDPQRSMLEQRLQGYTFEEIASKVNRSERTVRRFFDSLKAQLREQIDDPSGP